MIVLENLAIVFLEPFKRMFRYGIYTHHHHHTMSTTVLTYILTSP